MMDKDYTPWKLFEEKSRQFWDNCLVIHNDRCLTYGQTYDDILKLSEAFNPLNFRFAAIYLPNSIEFITCLLALNRIDKVVIPLSYQLKGESLYERINYCDAELVITDAIGYERLRSIQSRIDVGAIIVLTSAADFIKHDFAIRNVKNFEIGENVFGICFTSGSTSRPKGVVISNKAIVGNALAVAEYLDFREEDRILIVRSFAQASPISSDILMAVSRGGGIVISGDSFYPPVFLQTVQDNKVTSCILVRTMLAQVLDYPYLSGFNISSMKHIIFGGMTTPRSIVEDAFKKFPGIGLYNAYGMTEASTRVTFMGPNEMADFPESAGRPIRGCEVRIYREDGNEANEGEVGLIYVNSDYVMNGYYKSPDLNAAVLTSMGLKTGDMGYKSKEGLLYVVGRNDDLIIQGANNIYPIEIEEVLLRNPGIREAVVLGVDDKKLGKKVVALICVADNINLSPQDVSRWCRQNLEDRKVPKEIYIVDEIPKGHIGKIQKSSVKAYYDRLLLDRRI